MDVEDVTVEYSDDLTATFSCTASGGVNEDLVFTWNAPNDATDFNDRTRMETMNADNSITSTITTQPLSLSDRGEVYTCDVAYAGFPDRDSESFATLNIGKTIAIYQFGNFITSYSTVPAITMNPQSIFVGVGLGRNATFSCSAYGGPLDSSLSLMIDWSRPMNATDFDTNDVIVNDTVTSTLTLINVTEDYEGNYTCNVAYSDIPDVKAPSTIAMLSAVSKFISYHLS